MSNIAIKIRMSYYDLERFKYHIENSNLDLLISTKRKINLALLLGKDYYDNVQSHKINFNHFSRIDGLPIFVFEKIPVNSYLKDLIKNGELINFNNEDEIEIELIKTLEDNIKNFSPIL